ncbi:MAG: response regulator transcription factor [Phycisphaerales bacterium]|nr:response regulator transcription factor [Phycisphaerales bacterium]
MKPKLILVVDDETHISHVVSGKLRQAGMQVMCASDGEEAYELACASVPDLVITDFQMPLMSGLELSTKLRQNLATAHVPVMVVSARGHLITAEDKAQTNIRAVMCKPFGPRHLLERVHELLGLADAGQAGARAA